MLRDQLGKRLADEAGVDFDSDMPEPAAIKLARGAANPALRAAEPGAEPAKQRKAMADRTERFRFTDRPDAAARPEDVRRAEDRPGSRDPRRPPRRASSTSPTAAARRARSSTTTARETAFERQDLRQEADAARKPAPTASRRSRRASATSRAATATAPSALRRQAAGRLRRPPQARRIGDVRAADRAERPKRAYGDKPKR